MPFSNSHNALKLRFPAEDEFPDLSGHNNHMAKVLTPELYAELRAKCTPSGFTLDDVIQTGVDNPGHPYIMTVGCVAGDEESYDVFKELFDPIIEDRHGGYKPSDEHKTDLNPDNLQARAQLRAFWTLSEVSWLPCLPPECGPGRSPSFWVQPDGTPQGLRKFLGSGDPLELFSGCALRPPRRRHNDNKTFLVWINEEDHLRVISMQKGGNMKEVFTRFCNGLTQIETLFKSKNYEFMWNPHLGYILTCPSNLGTGLRAGVHIKLPHLGKHEKFPEVLKRLRLQKRGTGGVDTAAVGGVFDVSNADRLGFSEVELVQMVVDGVKLLIEMEQRQGPGQAIDDLVPAQK
uniref:Creatine kinase B-type n=1 Tax=Panthera tigris altaica TaxID=74533 RepID=A0A8C9M6X1_PANTA